MFVVGQKKIMLYSQNYESQSSPVGMTDDRTFHDMSAGERVCACVSLSSFLRLAFSYFKLWLGEFLFQNNDAGGKRL